MKIKLLSILVLFSSQISFSQTIKGKVVFNNYSIPNAEVINSNSRILTVSDAKGNFSIDAKTNDILVFIAKSYELKKVTVNPLIINNKDLIIELVLKAEELKEVVITKMPSIKLGSDIKHEQGKLSQYAIEKSAKAPKVTGIKMGTIENGFSRTFRMYGKNKEKPEIAFKDFAKTKINQIYFLKTLKLKPEEIELFLEFCDADSNSKTVAASNNILITMDFLFKKNMEFQKLHPSE